MLKLYRVKFPLLFLIVGILGFKQAEAQNSFKENYVAGYKLKLVANFWEPYTGANLQKSGIASNIVLSTLSSAGIEATIDVVPWARAYKMVKEGKADGIVAIWHTQERAEHILFSHSYLKNNLVLLKSVDRNINYDGLGSLDKLIIGLGRGYDYHQSIMNYHELDKVYFTRVEHAIEMLYKGRIDVLLTDKKIAQFHINNSSNLALSQELDFIPNSVFKLPLYFGMSKNINIQKR